MHSFVEKNMLSYILCFSFISRYIVKLLQIIILLSAFCSFSMSKTVKYCPFIILTATAFIEYYLQK